MSAIDHDYIYLQPPCCADEDVGRLWCEDPDPTDCDDGKHWTRYVRADIHEAAIAEAEQLRARVAELEAICENVPEGCTPADARVLREANHALAAEVAQAKWHKDIAEAALASAEQERDELRRQNGELLAESATHVGYGNRAVRRIKAEAVREACDKVLLDYRAVSFDKNENLYLNVVALRDYANQIEGGESGN